MKIIKAILPILIAVFLISFNGCDEFESLNIPIPIAIEVSTQGNVTSPVTLQEDFCLTEDSDYQNVQEDINELTFLEAAWRTLDGTTPGLTGNVNIVLEDINGNTLFSFLIPNGNLDSYKNDPFEFELTEGEIQAINTLLNSQTNKCFNAIATITVTSGSGSFMIEGAIDIVFEADTEL